MDYLIGYFPAGYHIPEYWGGVTPAAPDAMPFPTAGVLDDFQRDDSATAVGGEWATLGDVAHDMGIDSGRAYNPDGVATRMYHADRTYGPNCEVYVTLAVLPPQDAAVILYARLQDVAPGVDTFDGYQIQARRYDDDGTDTMAFQLARVDNGAVTTLTAEYTLTNPTGGLSFGLSVRGVTLRGYIYDDGAWLQVLSVSDATYTLPGYLGLAVDGETTARLDNFGGGVVVPPVVVLPIPVIPDLSWVNGAYVEMLVANHLGIPIGVLRDAELESAAWKLNEVGQARIVASPSTPAPLLQIGNRLLIRFDNGLRPWVGYIDPPRRWEFGRVTLTAYSGHRLLTQRVTARDRRFERVTAGGALLALLGEQAMPWVVAPGVIWQGGAALAEEFHLEPLHRALQHLAAAVGADFDVTGELVDGRVTFRLNFVERQGRPLPGVALLEGVNASVNSLEEQGPIVNHWLTAGAGAGWAETSRPYANAKHTLSVSAFGLRQDSAVMSDVADPATLGARTDAHLAATRDVYAAVSLTAINLPPGRFADYSVGDEVGVELYSMPSGGYDGVRRVVGMDFRPRLGGCEVLLA